MTLNLGWFSSGRDESARILLSRILKKKEEGVLDISIKFVFCNWEEDEEPQHPEFGQRQKFFQLVRELGIPLITLSWKRFRDNLTSGKKDEWRAAYGKKMRTLIYGSSFDLGILAGYNLWVDRDTCTRFNMLKLCPTLPNGPMGTAQEVVWQIISQKAGRHGITTLLCSPEQEEGIPLSCCSFPVQTPDYKPLWEQFDAAMGKRAFETISKDEVEVSALFQRIQRDARARELPLLTFTIRLLADGSAKIVNGRVHEEDRLRKSAYDLTTVIDEAIANGDF
jgi:phosphoribosylglycinamide formyltransferase-1